MHLKVYVLKSQLVDQFNQGKCHFSKRWSKYISHEHIVSCFRFTGPILFNMDFLPDEIFALAISTEKPPSDLYIAAQNKEDDHCKSQVHHFSTFLYNKLKRNIPRGEQKFSYNIPLCYHLRISFNLRYIYTYFNFWKGY